MAFNSREYEYADVTVFLGGKDLLGIRGVKYTEKIEREAIYAKGRNPHAIQSGNLAYEGEIALLQSEYDALEEASAGNVLELSLDLEVSFGNPSQGIALRTDRVKGLRFTEASKETKQGDKFMEIKLPFIALGIERNI